MDYPDPFADFTFDDQSAYPIDTGPLDSKPQRNNDFTPPLSQDLGNQQNLNSQISPFSDMFFDDNLSGLCDLDESNPFDNFDSLTIVPSHYEQMISEQSFENQLQNHNQQILSANENSVLEEAIFSTNMNQRSTSGRSKRTSKRKVDLSKKAELFKNAFYKVFTSKKKFPKHLVKEIHDFICQYIPLPKMKREHIRSIDLYFEEYSTFSEIILHALQQYKEGILAAKPEVANLK